MIEVFSGSGHLADAFAAIGFEVVKWDILISDAHDFLSGPAVGRLFAQLRTWHSEGRLFFVHFGVHNEVMTLFRIVGSISAWRAICTDGPIVGKLIPCLDVEQGSQGKLGSATLGVGQGSQGNLGSATLDVRIIKFSLVPPPGAQYRCLLH